MYHKIQYHVKSRELECLKQWYASLAVRMDQVLLDLASLLDRSSCHLSGPGGAGMK